MAVVYIWLQVPGTCSDVSMMVPRVDLANHSFGANAEWALDFSRGAVTLTATEDLAEVQPVCIDYGPDLDNTHLMRVFGFAVPGNPNDRLDFLQQQQNMGDSDSTTGNQQALLTGPFLKAVALDDVVNQYEQESQLHDGQGIVSCHKDPDLSRQLSAVLSLPVYAAEQQQTKTSNSHVDGQVPYQGMSTCIATMTWLCMRLTYC